MNKQQKDFLLDALSILIMVCVVFNVVAIFQHIMTLSQVPEQQYNPLHEHCERYALESKTTPSGYRVVEVCSSIPLEINTLTIDNVSKHYNIN